MCCMNAGVEVPLLDSICSAVYISKIESVEVLSRIDSPANEP